MAKIYIIEDDDALREELMHLLVQQGFDTDHARHYDRVCEDALEAAPDCVVVDLMLPSTNGHDICRAIRAKSDVPIIMLTSSDSEFDELMSMNLGADDYVTKPYNPAILIARIRSVVRRAGCKPESMMIEHKGVVLDQAKSEVSYQGRTTELTRNESRILSLLMENHSTIISRQEIMGELWQTDEFVDDNTLTVNINRSRQSLARIGIDGFLLTKRGQGYMV